MSLFEDFTNFLESRLEEFLQNNPQLELQVLSEQLKEQQRDTTKLINQLQLDETRIEGEILKVAKDIQTWHSRIDKAKGAGRQDLAEEAQVRENNLLNQGNLLWRQMQEVKQRITKAKELLISLEEKQQEINLKIAQLKATANKVQPNTSNYQTTTSPQNYQDWDSQYDSLENKFQQWEMEQELEAMKRNLNK
jgi:uncharacterized protein (TIGR04376 family)